ncbi:RCC1-like domain-containing protein [Janibacter alittae]|uniref:RCC1 domain-containing protein n=1 Tax=Janibacter alittae TaxID=3115209 RepID=A0ABZ2MLW1_9MICO
MSAGSIHTLGLRSGGTVVSTGNNADGQCSVSGWESIQAGP